MIPVKLVFLGTPEFAAVHLKSLLLNPAYEVVGVVTQPDRPAGRKMQLTPSPVKVLALEKHLPVLTPENLRKEPGVLELIRGWGAEAAVVVAFGQILSQEFLDSFKFGAVNVHGSLLPRWRGAAPIQRGLEAGDATGGVSLQRMVKKLDAGPIIGERKVNLDDEINATELYEKLSLLGCDLLDNDLLKYLKGELIPAEQDESRVTVAAKILKEESLIEWTMPALQIHNRVRAFSMGPGTYLQVQGKRLKLHRTRLSRMAAQSEPGTVIENHGGLLIQTSSGVLELLEVQPESKPRMPAAEFLKAHPFQKGDLFV